MDYPKYRLWRKNRSSPSSTDSCQGVDLNRNFDIEWGKVSSCVSVPDTVTIVHCSMEVLKIDAVKHIMD